MRGPMRELKSNPIVQHEGITSRKNINFIFIPIIDIDIQMEIRERDRDRDKLSMHQDCSRYNGDQGYFLFCVSLVRTVILSKKIY